MEYNKLKEMISTKMIHRKPQKLIDIPGEPPLIPLYLKPGVELFTVVDDIIEQIMEIYKLLKEQLD